jgi:sigma-B regulation protein RsbU (phosphoserine phosphatase)
MRILIAEDDVTSRRLLEARLRRQGHEVVLTEDGTEAWAALERDPGISLAILDWMMPGLTGPEVCERVRRRETVQPAYLILLTARTARQDLVSGLNAGADDYITKPFDFEELRARVQVGERVVRLQQSLAERVRELEDALANVNALQGLLPICLYCKKIRDDQNYWQQVDKYIGDHSGARFSHGVCPDCYERVVKPELGRYLKNGGSERE